MKISMLAAQMALRQRISSPPDPDLAPGEPANQRSADGHHLGQASSLDYPRGFRPEVRAQYSAMTIVCVCGASIPCTISGFDRSDVACTCGRQWRVLIQVTPGEDSDRQAGPELSCRG